LLYFLLFPFCKAATANTLLVADKWQYTEIQGIWKNEELYFLAGVRNPRSL